MKHIVVDLIVIRQDGVFGPQELMSMVSKVVLELEPYTLFNRFHMFVLLIHDTSPQVSIRTKHSVLLSNL